MEKGDGICLIGGSICQELGKDNTSLVKFRAIYQQLQLALRFVDLHKRIQKCI